MKSKLRGGSLPALFLECDIQEPMRLLAKHFKPLLYNAISLA